MIFLIGKETYLCDSKNQVAIIVVDERDKSVWIVRNATVVFRITSIFALLLLVHTLADW